MRKVITKNVSYVLSSILLGLGCISLVGPFFLMWIMYNLDIKTRVWLYHGPLPFGSSPFWIVTTGAFEICGVAFIISSILVKKFVK